MRHVRLVCGDFALPRRRKLRSRMARLSFAFAVLALGWTTWWRRRRSGPRRPGWSWLQETIVAGLRYNGERLMSLAPVDARRRVEALANPADLRKVEVEAIAIGAIPAQWFKAKGATTDTTLLYFHGGGYVLGSVESYRELLARIAVTCGVRVLAIDYRRAPEHPYPAALDDCLAAYRWALSSCIDPKQLLLAGDSSGGALARRRGHLAAVREHAARVGALEGLLPGGGALRRSDRRVPAHFTARAVTHPAPRSARSPNGSPRRRSR